MVHFVSDFGGADVMGAQWLYTSSLDLIVLAYIIFNRNTYNEAKNVLYPSSGAVEYVEPYGIDYLSNGFKIRAPTGYGNNNSGATYIYAAFAENPLKYANAR